MSPVLTDAWGVAPDPPAELVTPWATTLTRVTGQLYVEAETGTQRSLFAWQDQFARHGEQGRPRWSCSPGGVLYLVAGARVAVLWPGWSAGHLAVGGGAGVWLVSDVTFGLARRTAEEWWMAAQVELAGAVDVDGLLTTPVHRATVET